MCSDLPEGEAESFADAIIQGARVSVHTCKVCQNLTDAEFCPICASDKRDKGVICVVAEPRDVASIERGREYNGVYHVLHGVLSPLSHIGPDDLKISELVNRVAAGGVEEVIMALNPDTEGETTSMYISRLLKPFGVRVTRLAYGIPVSAPTWNSPTTPHSSARLRDAWKCERVSGRLLLQVNNMPSPAQPAEAAARSGAFRNQRVLISFCTGHSGYNAYSRGSYIYILSTKEKLNGKT